MSLTQADSTDTERKGGDSLKRELIAAIAVCIMSAIIVGTVQKSKYQFGGIWVGIDPSNPETAIFYCLVSAEDVVGKREYSYYINHFNIDVTFGGYFPDAVLFGDGVGHGYATGKKTFACSSLICALDENGVVQYYMIGSGNGEWINEDEQSLDFTISIYLPEQDVDPYDGLPDEEQAPILCLEVPLYIQRVPHYTPCEPT